MQTWHGMLNREIYVTHGLYSVLGDLQEQVVLSTLVLRIHRWTKCGGASPVVPVQVRLHGLLALFSQCGADVQLTEGKTRESRVCQQSSPPSFFFFVRAVVRGEASSSDFQETNLGEQLVVMLLAWLAVDV